VAELQQFLTDARLAAIGVFGYSDEDGTEAASLPGQLPAEEIAARVEDLAALADELMSQRAADRIGETAEVLVEEPLGDGRYAGLAAHQAPEVDGAVTLSPRTRSGRAFLSAPRSLGRKGGSDRPGRSRPAAGHRSGRRPVRLPALAPGRARRKSMPGPSRAARRRQGRAAWRAPSG
jgi:hypothetical protein